MKKNKFKVIFLSILMFFSYIFSIFADFYSPFIKDQIYYYRLIEASLPELLKDLTAYHDQATLFRGNDRLYKAFQKISELYKNSKETYTFPGIDPESTIKTLYKNENDQLIVNPKDLEKEIKTRFLIVFGIHKVLVDLMNAAETFHEKLNRFDGQLHLEGLLKTFQNFENFYAKNSLKLNTIYQHEVTIINYLKECFALDDDFFMQLIEAYKIKDDDKNDKKYAFTFEADMDLFLVISQNMRDLVEATQKKLERCVLNQAVDLSLPDIKRTTADSSKLIIDIPVPTSPRSKVVPQSPREKIQGRERTRSSLDLKKDLIQRPSDEIEQPQSPRAKDKKLTSPRGGQDGKKISKVKLFIKSLSKKETGKPAERAGESQNDISPRFLYPVLKEIDDIDRSKLERTKLHSVSERKLEQKKYGSAPHVRDYATDGETVSSKRRTVSQPPRVMVDPHEEQDH